MRLFAAVVPPANVIEDLEEFLAPRRGAADFRWTLAEQWHLTLAFAGDAPERVLDDLLDRLARAAAKRAAISMRLAGGGAFPDAARAKLVYAAVDHPGSDRTELSRLATGAKAAFGKAGAGVDGARFRPHLSIARPKRPSEVSNWVRLLDGYRGPAWTLEDIVLMASYLGEGPRGRPRHEPLASFSLCG